MASRMMDGAARTGRLLGSRGGIGLVGVAAGVGLTLGVPRLIERSVSSPEVIAGPATESTRLRARPVGQDTRTLPLAVTVRSDTYVPSWSPLGDFRERDRLVEIPSRRVPLEELRSLIEGECLVAVQLDPDLLRRTGLEAGEVVAVPRGPITVERLLDAIANEVSRTGGAVVGRPAVRAVWTYSGNVLYLTSLERLDAASQELRVYELSDFVSRFASTTDDGARAEVAAALAAVLEDQARRGAGEPAAGFRSSGASGASGASGETDPGTEPFVRSYAADLVGERLFVTAPERIHHRLTWVLNQIGTEGIAEGKGDERYPRSGAGPEVTAASTNAAALPDPGGD
jgi:hypothetical protein